jgi:hypothetical protein
MTERTEFWRELPNGDEERWDLPAPAACCAGVLDWHGEHSDDCVSRTQPGLGP